MKGKTIIRYDKLYNCNGLYYPSIASLAYMIDVNSSALAMKLYRSFKEGVNTVNYKGLDISVQYLPVATLVRVSQ